MVTKRDPAAIIDAVTSTSDAYGQDWRDELGDLYERYIEAFNARDEAAFTAFFHLPVNIFRLPVDGGDAPNSGPVEISDPRHLWPVLPPTWTRSTIDSVRVVGDDTAFAPRPGFTDRAPRRAALEVTVTRWAGDEPYEQVHVLYILTRVEGRLGITAMVPLAVARPG
jgi:hypothetical protein